MILISTLQQASGDTNNDIPKVPSTTLHIYSGYENIVLSG